MALYPDDLETADLLLAGCVAPMVVNEAIWVTGDPVRGFDVAEALINQGLLRVVRVDTADLYRASVQTRAES